MFYQSKLMYFRFMADRRTDPADASLEVFRLAGEPVRWRLLQELARSDRHVRELTELVGRPQNLVSYHLGKLRSAGLVVARRSSADGRDAYYTVALDRFSELLAAAGRSLYATGAAGDVFACDGTGDANILRFAGVEPGDEVLVDNRKFLAYCYYARHHVIDDEPAFAHLMLDGAPIYPQHPVPRMSSLMGVCYCGQYEGKVLWIHHTHDSSVWPAWGTLYHRAVRQAQGEAGARENFRIRWTEYAEHGPYGMVPAEPNRVASTRLIDFRGITEQSMMDLIDWAENGVEPSGTNYAYADGQVRLPSTAAERGGIQPVASATANGGARAEVKVGEPVTLTVTAAVPPGTGTIIAVEWDFDGSGTYPFRHDGIDGTATELTVSTTRSYDRPGTYFGTARVTSHRTGDVHAELCRIETIAQARTVVTADV